MLHEKAYCNEGLGAGYFLPLCNAVQTLWRRMGYLRLKGSTAGPQVQQCSTQNCLQRETSLLNTMAGCIFSISKGRISADGAFLHPQLQHSHGDFFPLRPTSVSSAASLSHCFLALPWASQRTWLCPLSSQTMDSNYLHPLPALHAQLSQDTTLMGMWQQLHQWTTRWVCDTICPHGSLSTLGTLSSPLFLVCTKSSQGLRSWETHFFSWLHRYLGTKMFLTPLQWSEVLHCLWRLGCWILHLSPLRHFP